MSMKTLVYYTIGCSRAYVDMLAISLNSLRAVYSGSIGVICDESFVDDCKKRFPDVLVWRVSDSKSGPAASMNKLRIFDFIADGEYDSVVYLDTDILVMESPMQYFERITNPDVLYVYTECKEQVGHKLLYWSLQSYTKEDYTFLRERGILPFNAGTFGFVPSPQMREHFRNVRDMIVSHTGPYFYEQSFMNAYFNLRDKTDRSVFTPDTYIFAPQKGRMYPNATVLHFADAGLRASQKCANMREYMARASGICVTKE
jgi:alpha-N-acetylglucosamine transferase